MECMPTRYPAQLSHELITIRQCRVVKNVIAEIVSLPGYESRVAAPAAFAKLAGPGEAGERAVAFA